MPWFQISDYQRVKMEWLVEARDAETARQQFLDSSTPIFIVTQSVEDSDGVSVEAWDGPAPAPGLAGHVTDAASDLLASLRAILPYAESRAEDMQECDSENVEPDYVSAETIKAVAAVDAAKALLASLDGSPDAADASEGKARAVEREEEADAIEQIERRVYCYRDSQPEEGLDGEEDESWRSWFYAAFDLLSADIQEIKAASKPA